MITIRKSFGNIDLNGFIKNYDEFNENIKNCNSIDCVKNGIKALTICFISLNENDKIIAKKYLKKSVKQLIEKEINQNCLSYGEKNVSVRMDIEINNAFSHEKIKI